MKDITVVDNHEPTRERGFLYKIILPDGVEVKARADQVGQKIQRYIHNHPGRYNIDWKAKKVRGEDFKIHHKTNGRLEHTLPIDPSLLPTRERPQPDVHPRTAHLHKHLNRVFGAPDNGIFAKSPVVLVRPQRRKRHSPVQ